MEPLNVVVTSSSVGEQYMQQIRDVSSDIKLTNVSPLYRAERKGDSASKEKLDAILAEAEVLFNFSIPGNIVSRAPRLKWIQLMSAGVDRLLNDEIARSPVIMTNISGVHATPIGEFVIGVMLMFVKQAPLCFQLKQEKQWRRLFSSVLRSRTVGIVGLGNIGREVARLSKAFGMRVLATRRSARQTSRARHVDVIYPLDRLPELLAESDFVVLTLPLTPETGKFIGEKELRTMKRTAYLINIARGGVVDEEALTRALEEGWIAGAGLDVFTTEPLPSDSRLWDFPNVIISPHMSGGMEDYTGEATGVFCRNLRRYLDGKRLLNVVDKKKGY